MRLSAKLRCRKNRGCRGLGVLGIRVGIVRRLPRHRAIRKVVSVLGFSGPELHLIPVKKEPSFQSEKTCVNGPGKSRIHPKPQASYRRGSQTPLLAGVVTLPRICSPHARCLASSRKGRYRKLSETPLVFGWQLPVS